VFDYYLERIDWPVAVRGAGNGFGILVIAGLLTVALATGGMTWAPAVLWVGWPLGFILAAWKSGAAPSPPLTGAVAAFFAYTLTIPLIYMSRQGFNVPVIISTLAAGTAIGAITGWVMGRRAGAGSAGSAPRR
jgi:hypothetical protein